jgi:hypothetical protein
MDFRVSFAASVIPAAVCVLLGKFDGVFRADYGCIPSVREAVTRREKSTMKTITRHQVLAGGLCYVIY